MVSLSVDVLACQNDCIQGLAFIDILKVSRVKGLVVCLVRMEQVKGQILQYVEVASQVVKKWSDERLLPGQYPLSFTLNVPRGLPGDVEIERRNVSVSITHWLTVSLLGSRCREVSRRVCISSEHVAEVSEVKFKRSFATSGCFCFSSSTTHIVSRLPSAVAAYTPIQVHIDVDSRSSRHSLKDLVVRLVQRVSLANGQVYDEKLLAESMDRLRKGKRHLLDIELFLDKSQAFVESAMTCLGLYVKVEYFVKLEGRHNKTRFDFELGSVVIVNFIGQVRPMTDAGPTKIDQSHDILMLQRTASTIKTQSSFKRVPLAQEGYDEPVLSKPIKNTFKDNSNLSLEEVELSGLDGFYKDVVRDLAKQQLTSTKPSKPSRITFDLEDAERAPLQRALSTAEMTKVVEQIEDRNPMTEKSISMHYHGSCELNRQRRG